MGCGFIRAEKKTMTIPTITKKDVTMQTDH